MKHSEFKKFLDKNPEIRTFMMDVYPTSEQACSAFNDLAQDMKPRQISLPNSQIAALTGCMTGAILLSALIETGLQAGTFIGAALLSCGYFGVAKGVIFGLNKAIAYGAKKPEEVVLKMARDYTSIGENEKRVVKKRTLENGFKNGYMRYRAI